MLINKLQNLITIYYTIIVLKQRSKIFFQIRNNKDTKKWTVLIIQIKLLNNQAIILNQVNSINKWKRIRFSVIKKIANQVYFTQTKNMTAVVKKFLINKLNKKTISNFTNLIKRMDKIFWRQAYKNQ